jgi:hypothetical protein
MSLGVSRYLQLNSCGKLLAKKKAAAAASVTNEMSEKPECLCPGKFVEIRRFRWLR